MAGDGYYDVAGINANAAKLTHTQTSSSKTQSQSASGDTTGSVNATISKQDSNSKTTRTTHVASDVDLGNTTGSLGDVASIGSNVHLTVQDPSQVQINSITVQSLQDSIQSKNQSKGGSVGVGYQSGSVGYNQSKGYEDTLQTHHIANITIDGNADLDNLLINYPSMEVIAVWQKENVIMILLVGLLIQILICRIQSLLVIVDRYQLDLVSLSI